MPGHRPSILIAAAAISLLLRATSVPAGNGSGWTYDAGNDRIGRIYYYEHLSV
jgi:hypothetical protein